MTNQPKMKNKKTTRKTPRTKIPQIHPKINSMKSIMMPFKKDEKQSKSPQKSLQQS